MTTYRLMDGASGRPGVGSSGTTPPSAGTSYVGAYMAGLVFKVTQGSAWFQGYWWWVAASGQDTSALKCALWQIYGTSTGSATHGSVVPNSTVTSGTLTAGAWNYIPLSTPIALSAYIPYVAAIGGTFSLGFPDTLNQFGVSDPYASGITNGPLTAYASAAAAADDLAQQPYALAADPSVAMPTTNDHEDLLWVDVQVTTTDPLLGSYRVFPSMVRPWPSIQTANDQTGYTLGLEFSLTKPCTLSKIWHYSPDATDGAAATVLPTRCAIWNVATTTAVAGTDNQSPSWKKPDGTSASAGNGWVYCDYSGAGVTLAASTNYKVSTYHAAGANWFGATPNVWDTGDLYASGMTQGPIVVPNNGSASPGQQSWNTVSWAYPATSGNPEADYIDVEVIPVTASGSGLLMATFP